MESPRFSAHTHALVTSLIAYASFLAAYIIRFYVLRGVMNYGFFTYNIMALLCAALHYAVFSLGFYHRNDLRRRLGGHVTGTIFCKGVCLAGLLSALYVLRMPDFSRMCVLIAAALSLILNCVKHSVVLKTSAAYYKSGANRRAVLLIGEGEKQLTSPSELFRQGREAAVLCSVCDRREQRLPYVLLEGR